VSAAARTVLRVHAVQLGHFPSAASELGCWYPITTHGAIVFPDVTRRGTDASATRSFQHLAPGVRSRRQRRREQRTQLFCDSTVDLPLFLRWGGVESLGVVEVVGLVMEGRR
jgi:hypothetical protein